MSPFSVVERQPLGLGIDVRLSQEAYLAGFRSPCLKQREIGRRM
jgi:hypothetical protein